jgi:polyphosphate kinase 2 (PPK2 family)
MADKKSKKKDGKKDKKEKKGKKKDKKKQKKDKQEEDSPAADPTTEAPAPDRDDRAVSPADPTSSDKDSPIAPAKKKKLTNKVYNQELRRLQVELVKLQEWVKAQKLKVVVIFEGRDAAGKGGVIKRITQCLNPRTARVVALGVPTEREKSQWYFQRYVPHLPAAGEIVLFDRSWYNRAGVERVMGF